MFCARAPVAIVAAFLLAGCPRPPVDALDAGPADGGGFTLEALIQDDPAIGGDWYLYTPENHTVASRDQVYLLRDNTAQPARYVVFRVVSYYDEDTAESGRFTLAFSDWSAGWQAEQTWRASRLLGQDNPLCLDAFTRTEVDCAGTSWHLMMRSYSLMVSEGPLIVGEGAFYVPSVVAQPTLQRVSVATVLGTQTLSAAPDPATVPELSDGPPPDWNRLDWNLAAWAPQLPRAGMVLGTRFVAEGFHALPDVYILLNVRKQLIKFTLAPVTDGQPAAGLHVRWAVSALDLTTRGPTTWGAIRELDVPLPASAGARTWLNLDSAEVILTTAPELASVTPYLPLKERLWDLSVMTGADGTPMIASSPSVALGNLGVLLGRSDLTLEDALQ